MRLAITPLAAALVAAAAMSTPRPKDVVPVTVGTLDRITTYAADLTPEVALTVSVRQPDGTFETVWLVFVGAEVEAKALELAAGSQVAVRGKTGSGGRWKYIVVNSIAGE